MTVSTTRPVSGTGFFNRRTELEELGDCLGRRQFAAVIGPRRIGKSSLVQEFLRRLNESRDDALGFRFEVHKNVTSPSVFAVRLLSVFLGELVSLRCPEVEIDRVALRVDPRQFGGLIGRLESAVLDDLFKFLLQYLPMRGTGERDILEKVLVSLDEYAREQGMALAVAMDEFQEITRLERFKGGFDKDTFLGFWEGTTAAMSNTWFVITGSMVKIMEDVMLSGASPLYGRYQHVRLAGFAVDDARSYLSGLVGSAVPAEVCHFITTLSEGHPYYLTVLGQGLAARRSSKPPWTLTLEEARGAALEEIQRGALAMHCRYLLDVSLAHARRGDSLLQPLELLAQSGAGTATELARITGQQPGAISPLLQNLVEVDLLRKEGARYFIMDRILRAWLECVHGFTTPELTRLRKRLTEPYEEAIARLREDRGQLLEYAVRELMRKFDGRQFQGRPLPAFDQVQQLYLADPEGVVDGKPSQQEIDAYGSGAEPWMVEVRWRTKPVTKRDLERFRRRKTRLEQEVEATVSVLAVISVAGFSSGALQLAESNPGLWLIDGPKLQALFRELGQAPPTTLAQGEQPE